VFSGNHSNNIDDQNRVIIPVKQRQELGERVIVTRGVDRCLNIFTPEAWDDYRAEYIENNRKSKKDVRRLVRFLVGYSHELTIDRQGRINIPQDLIDYAGFEKEVLFVGCIDFIELWSKQIWDEEMDPSSFDPDELMESLETANATEK
jgi:MraZ protein